MKGFKLGLVARRRLLARSRAPEGRAEAEGRETEKAYILGPFIGVKRSIEARATSSTMVGTL